MTVEQKGILDLPMKKSIKYSTTHYFTQELQLLPLPTT